MLNMKLADILFSRSSLLFCFHTFFAFHQFYVDLYDDTKLKIRKKSVPGVRKPIYGENKLPILYGNLNLLVFRSLLRTSADYFEGFCGALILSKKNYEKPQRILLEHLGILSEPFQKKPYFGSLIAPCADTPCPCHRLAENLLPK